MEENKSLGEGMNSHMEEDHQPVKVEQELKAKVNLPFDLNNLFNMSYSFDVLKEAIEFLAQQHAEFDLKQANLD